MPNDSNNSSQKSTTPGGFHPIGQSMPEISESQIRKSDQSPNGSRDTGTALTPAEGGSRRIGQQRGATGLTRSKMTDEAQVSHVADILSKLSSMRYWAIPLTDQKAATSALRMLDSISETVTYDQAAIWISKLLSHFPRRDSTKDQIIVSDLAAELVECGISHGSVAYVYKQTWINADNENPFFPPAGQIRMECLEKDRSFALTYEHLEKIVAGNHGL